MFKEINKDNIFEIIKYLPHYQAVRNFSPIAHKRWDASLDFDERGELKSILEYRIIPTVEAFIGGFTQARIYNVENIRSIKSKLEQEISYLQRDFEKTNKFTEEQEKFIEVGTYLVNVFKDTLNIVKTVEELESPDQIPSIEYSPITDLGADLLKNAKDNTQSYTYTVHNISELQEWVHKAKYRSNVERNRVEVPNYLKQVKPWSAYYMMDHASYISVFTLIDGFESIISLSKENNTLRNIPLYHKAHRSIIRMFEMFLNKYIYGIVLNHHELLELVKEELKRRVSEDLMKDSSFKPETLERLFNLTSEVITILDNYRQDELRILKNAEK